MVGTATPLTVSDWARVSSYTNVNSWRSTTYPAATSLLAMYSAESLWPFVPAARLPPLRSASRWRAIRWRFVFATSTFLTSCRASAGPSGIGGTAACAEAGTAARLRPVAVASNATPARNVVFADGMKIPLVTGLSPARIPRPSGLGSLVRTTPLVKTRTRTVMSLDYRLPMHAITVSEPGGPDVLSWTEQPDPQPGPGEVVLDVVATAVNRADLLQRQGSYAPPPGVTDIPGLECSGRVTALGEGVSGLSVGDEVCALLAGGGYAQKVVVPAGQVMLKPSTVDLVTAAGLPEVAATVWSNVAMGAG